MIHPMTRLAIHHQSAVARSHAAIASAINRSQPDEPVSVRSVRRILSESKPDLAALNGDAVGPGPGRPSCAEPFRHQVATLLESESELSTVELLRRCRESGYTGGKSAFYDLVKSVRKPSVGAEPIVRFEGVPGEYAQFDFGERWIEYVDGTRRKVIAFVGRLKYSRHVHVEIVPDQKVACLEAWRCVPLIWVFDNPKTVRTSAIGQPIVIHSYLAGLAAELNAAVLLCTPHQPQQKGAVERGVGWFKNGFLAQRRFVDAADLQSQLTAWLVDVNGSRPSDATDVIPGTRLVQEQAALRDRPLPFTAAQFALRLPATVLPTGTVHILGTTYSVDPKRVGAPAMVLLRAAEIEIIIGGSRCVHRRVDFCDLPQRLPEHRREMLGAVFGERKRNSFQRQCLWELGREAQDFLEGLVHRCGADAKGWYRPVAQLYALLEEHGDSVLREAMASAHGAKGHDVPAVVRALRPRALLGNVTGSAEGTP